MGNLTRYPTGPLGKHLRPKAIELLHITVLQEGRPVLQDVTLDIFEGESVAILGAPATGKSALLACIQGLMQPVKGTIFVLGRSLLSMPLQIRRQIGVMPHTSEIKTDETVAACLQRFASYYGISLTPEQMRTYCAHYQLPPSTPLSQLRSLQQRVFSLALGLVHDPHLILLDDPLAGLATEDVSACRTYLQRIHHEGRTMLCTYTQPLENISFRGYDVVVELEQGRLLEPHTRRRERCR